MIPLCPGASESLRAIIFDKNLIFINIFERKLII